MVGGRTKTMQLGMGHQDLMPVTMQAVPAPQTLLKIVACRYKKGYIGSYTCRKARGEDATTSLLSSWMRRTYKIVVPLSPAPTDPEWMRSGLSKRAKL